MTVQVCKFVTGRCLPPLPWNQRDLVRRRLTLSTTPNSPRKPCAVRKSVTTRFCWLFGLKTRSMGFDVDRRKFVCIGGGKLVFSGFKALFTDLVGLCLVIPAPTGRLIVKGLPCSHDSWRVSAATRTSRMRRLWGASHHCRAQSEQQRTASRLLGVQVAAAPWWVGDKPETDHPKAPRRLPRRRITRRGVGAVRQSLRGVQCPEGLSNRIGHRPSATARCRVREAWARGPAGSDVCALPRECHPASEAVLVLVSPRVSTRADRQRILSPPRPRETRLTGHDLRRGSPC
jgi:hypothetical protein